MTDPSPQELAAAPTKCHQDRGTRIAWSAISIIGVGVLVLGGWRMRQVLSSYDPASLLDRHGPAVIGIPLAVCVATIFVGVMRAIEGQFKLDFLGLKAEGAAASACLWIAAFAAISLVIRVLW